MDALMWLTIPLIAGVLAGIWAVQAGRPREQRPWTELEQYRGFQAALARKSPGRS
ncbi:hypothetical protein [Streptomyces sp. JJ36]|uniref:hypothetical protein n=1 Tax=Streptomyces sp. JJ36 TaxID=2736645 RepID=UPI001F47FF49|nr:hypothetical protein [Streptomyces sp. JJ36]MCF6525461.1 hypothetical protein [Streptomyces sp. JJ36]